MRTRVRRAPEAPPSSFYPPDPREGDGIGKILRLPRVQRASAAAASGGAPHSHGEALWNFVSMHGQLDDDDATRESARGLAEEIAKAMHHRPLMSRLARIESQFGVVPSARGATPAATTPPALPVGRDEPAAPPALSASIDELMEEFGESVSSPPKSVEWLGKARRERNRRRLHNVAAWLATLTIGGSIVATTILLLHR
jgi:hypothetical protein